jgi:hypothetical protein
MQISLDKSKVIQDTDSIKGGTMKLTYVTGRVEDVVKPSPRYAEVAMACSEMGMDIANDDYERIDTLLESNSMWTTTPAKDASGSIDFLVEGYLPHGSASHNAALPN